MRARTIWLAMTLALAAAPAVARADSVQLGGCLLGPSQLDRCSVSGAPAAALAAIAAPVLVAGAAVTVAHELHQHTVERAAAAAPATPTSAKAKAQAQAQAQLALLPAARDPYRAAAAAPDRARPPNHAAAVNEAITDVGIAVTGAAVIGAIIADVAQHH